MTGRWRFGGVGGEEYESNGEDKEAGGGDVDLIMTAAMEMRAVI